MWRAARGCPLERSSGWARDRAGIRSFACADVARAGRAAFGSKCLSLATYYRRCRRHRDVSPESVATARGGPCVAFQEFEPAAAQPSAAGAPGYSCCGTRHRHALADRTRGHLLLLLADRVVGCILRLGLGRILALGH